MNASRLLPRATIAALALGTGCTPSASFKINVDLGGFDLDQEVKAFETAACVDVADPACAVLSTLAGVPYVMGDGPQETPALPASFADRIEVPSLEQQVDVAAWYVDVSQQRIDDAVGACADDASNEEAVAGCSFGRRRRVDLGDINAGTIDPAVLADAVIERAVIVRDENDSLELPAFELFVGQGDEEPTLVAQSEAFDIGGVAVLDVDPDTMVMLSEALAADGGFIDVGTVDDAVPTLARAEDGSLRRPGGAMRLSLALQLRVPLTAVAGALQSGSL